MFDVDERTNESSGDDRLHFLSSVTRYRMADYEHNEDLRQQLGMTDINTVIKNCQNK
jgi:hypothetical protein